MTYAEKLLDPRWQKKRLEIFNRDKWTCQHCDSEEKTLHLHHLEYINGREPWDYPDNYLLTLCDICHEKTKNRTKECEGIITQQFKLKIKNPFLQQCVASVFKKYEDLDGLFYMLWEMIDRQNDVDSALRAILFPEHTVINNNVKEIC